MNWVLDSFCRTCLHPNTSLVNILVTSLTRATSVCVGKKCKAQQRHPWTLASKSSNNGSKTKEDKRSWQQNGVHDQTTSQVSRFSLHGQHYQGLTLNIRVLYPLVHVWMFGMLVVVAHLVGQLILSSSNWQIWKQLPYGLKLTIFNHIFVLIIWFFSSC